MDFAVDRRMNGRNTGALVGKAERFIGTYKLVVLNAEMFASLHEAAAITRQWLGCNTRS